MSDRYESLRERITEHCRWIATYDRAYAIWTFNRYADEMPWLGLRKKRATNV